MTVHEDRRRPGLVSVPRGHAKARRNGAEVLVRSKDPLVVIAKVRRALESLEVVEIRPKAFKQSGSKSA